MPSVKIDLENARSSKEAKVLSGRAKGKHWREQFKLDELDAIEGTVIVMIPEDIFSINLSFFLSLFGESVRRLGKEKFLAKYQFRCDPVLEPLIQQGVEQAVKRSSALPQSA